MYISKKVITTSLHAPLIFHGILNKKPQDFYSSSLQTHTHSSHLLVKRFPAVRCCTVFIRGLFQQPLANFS